MKVLLKILITGKDRTPVSGVQLGSCVSRSGHNNELSFNPDFLELSDGNNAKNIDLSYFMNASGAAPENILLTLL